jgi:redox-sensitive bicupin YhaK (pirin superfamily)
MKNIIGVYSAPQSHWVGDGFPVRSLFSYNNHGKALSPFLLLDYAGPAEFPPGNDHHRGVAEHPHRGFETVTIVYKGEVAHRDSTGKGGVIGPGDVQWMTAAAGILHEEFHSEAFSRSGGVLEMVQLWVNLPAKDKMTPPKYQAILNRDIPAVALPKEAGTVRVIAGNYAGHAGPASTFSPCLSGMSGSTPEPVPNCLLPRAGTPGSLSCMEPCRSMAAPPRGMASSWCSIQAAPAFRSQPPMTPSCWCSAVNLSMNPSRAAGRS